MEHGNIVKLINQKMQKTMLNLPVTLGGVIGICMVYFSIRGIIFSEKNKLLRLASIVKRISFERNISEDQ